MVPWLRFGCPPRVRSKRMATTANMFVPQTGICVGAVVRRVTSLGRQLRDSPAGRPRAHRRRRIELRPKRPARVLHRAAMRGVPARRRGTPSPRVPPRCRAPSALRRVAPPLPKSSLVRQGTARVERMEDGPDRRPAVRAAKADRRARATTKCRQLAERLEETLPEAPRSTTARASTLKQRLQVRLAAAMGRERSGPGARAPRSAGPARPARP